jgi:hypothetical protein
VLHRGFLDFDRVEVEELDRQIWTRGESPTNHEPVSDLRLEEQDLSGVSESLCRVRSSL